MDDNVQYIGVDFSHHYLHNVLVYSRAGRPNFHSMHALYELYDNVANVKEHLHHNLMDDICLC